MFLNKVIVCEMALSNTGIINEARHLLKYYNAIVKSTFNNIKSEKT